MNIDQTLRTGLKKLRGDRERLDRQITAIEEALRVVNGAAPTSGPRGRERKGMSPTARKAISRRMKAYWAKRKAGKSGRR